MITTSKCRFAQYTALTATAYSFNAFSDKYERVYRSFLIEMSSIHASSPMSSAYAVDGLGGVKVASPLSI